MDGGRLWLGPHSPPWGCSGLAAWATARIPRRTSPSSFRTGFKDNSVLFLSSDDSIFLLFVSPGKAAENLLVESNLAKARGDLDRAIVCIEEAITLAGELQPLLLNRAGLLRESRQFASALQTLDRLLGLYPYSVDGHLAEGFIRMLMGDWDRGWRKREWRWNHPHFRKLMPPQLPVWDGSSAFQSRLWVVLEQGFGDFIQFSRLLPEIRNRVGEVIVRVPKALMSMARCSFPQIKWVEESEVPIADCWVGLMSLPERLRLQPDQVTGADGYLKIPFDRLQNEAPSHGDLRIGLVHAGNSGHANDRFRSMSVEALSGLAEIPGVRWCQVQPEVRDANRLPMKLESPPFPLKDFAATALWIQSLDLVLSVDTSVAHLAGALGIPVWILLPYAPDWRWGVHGVESIWYRSARLFRQPRPLDWAAVLQDVRGQLPAFKAARHGNTFQS